jgi:uncharacterized protein YndB with AHSA1/START domain
MVSLTGSFSIPLDLAARPEQVWSLLTDPALREKWVRMPGPSSTATRQFDFRVGGGERLTNTFVSGDVAEDLENRSTFHDIVQNQRIVFSYEALVAGILRWVALVTVDLAANDEGGTHLDWTEQYSFVQLSTPGGGDDVKHLVGGTRLRLNGLVAALATALAAPLPAVEAAP